MNKDALLATAIGFFIGLCITGLLLVGPSILKNIPKFSMPAVRTQQPDSKKPDTQKSPPPAGFAINSPLDESIESTEKILVSGTALPGSLIVITGEIQDTVTTTSPDGAYAGSVSLAEGKNLITVTQYQSDTPKTLEITVFFTPEEI